MTSFVLNVPLGGGDADEVCEIGWGLEDKEADAVAFSVLHEITDTVPLLARGESDDEPSSAPKAPPASPALAVASDRVLATFDLLDLPSVLSEHFRLPPRAETWDAEEVRRHWLLLNHCEWLLVPLAYPSLKMATPLGAYYWSLHTTHTRHRPEFLAEERRCVSAGLRDLAMYKPQPQELIWCEQLMASVRTDPMARASAVRRFAQFLTAQRGLVMVCLEHARLEPRELGPLLRDLGAASGGGMRRLYLWHALRRPIDPISLRKRGKKLDRCVGGRVWRRGPNRQAPGGPALLAHTLALPLFSGLTVLAVDYCDVADPCGQALLTLAAVRAGTLRQLHLLLEAQELPRRSQGGESEGAVPDWAWRRARQLCPDFRVHIVVCACPTYDEVAGVLSRSLPLAQLHLSSGVDLRFRQPWLVDCIWRELRVWYTQMLVYLSLFLWRNRDRLDSLLLRSLKEFPLLEELEFVGCLDDLASIERLADFAIKEPWRCQRLRLLVVRPQLELVGAAGAEDAEGRRQAEALWRRFAPLLAERRVVFDCRPYPV